jgi:hypothetical protein
MCRIVVFDENGELRVGLTEMPENEDEAKIANLSWSGTVPGFCFPFGKPMPRTKVIVFCVVLHLLLRMTRL